MLCLFLFLYNYYVFLFKGCINMHKRCVCFYLTVLRRGGACLYFVIYVGFVVITCQVCCIKLIKRAFVGRVLSKLYKM